MLKINESIMCNIYKGTATFKIRFESPLTHHYNNKNTDSVHSQETITGNIVGSSNTHKCTHLQKYTHKSDAQYFALTADEDAFTSLLPRHESLSNVLNREMQAHTLGKCCI